MNMRPRLLLLLPLVWGGLTPAKAAPDARPFFRIAKSVEEAEALINQGADVNEAAHNGWTALHSAQSPEMVEMLLRHGAKVNVPANGQQKEYPIQVYLRNLHPRGPYYPMDEQRLKMVNLLLDAGANEPRHLLADLRRTMETNVSKEDLIKVFTLLLDHGFDPLGKTSWDGRTSLMLAAALTPELTKRLLEAGVDPKATTREGMTALHYAANAETVDMLLRAGAPVNTQGHASDQAKQMKPPVPTILKSVAEDQILPIAKLLIDAGAQVKGDSWDAFDYLYRVRTPEARKELTALLKKAGGDVSHGWRYADFRERVPTEELLAAGADPRYTGLFGNRSPLFQMLYIGSLEEAELLLRAGADINVRDAWGDTPLSVLVHVYSVRKNRDPDIKRRIEHTLRLGGDPTIKNNKGESALQLARKMKLHDIVRLFENSKRR